MYVRSVTCEGGWFPLGQTMRPHSYRRQGVRRGPARPEAAPPPIPPAEPTLVMPAKLEPKPPGKCSRNATMNEIKPGCRPPMPMARGVQPPPTPAPW